MEPSAGTSLLKFLPVSIFGAVMGMCGLSAAWRLANRLWHLQFIISEIIGVTAIVLFLILSMAFIYKYRKYPDLIRSEFNHPVTVSFYATIIIGLLLMPGLLLPYVPMVAAVMWSLGTILIIFFAWFVLRKWMDKQQLPESAMPAWAIPILGTLDVPIFGTQMPIHRAYEICVVFYGIGLVFGVILLVIIISRLLFQTPLPAALQPTILILTAPFALAFSGYENLAVGQGIFASIIFYFNLFLLVLFSSKILMLPKTCPFFVSWWSVGFPLAAVTISALRYADHSPGPIHQVIAAALLIITTSVIVFLTVQTLYRISNGTFASLAPRL